LVEFLLFAVPSSPRYAPLLIVLAGAVTLPTIPISLYPELAPPQVVVTAIRRRELAGRRVGGDDHLEQAINGVEGMRYISSASSNDGTSEITITFQTATIWTLPR